MPQRFTVEDLYLHRKIGTLHAVPAANAAIGTVRSIDRGADTHVTHLWRFALDGSGARQLTFSGTSNTAARWSPDGRRIAFLSDRAGGASQVHVMDGDGGEARQVGSFPLSVSSLRWMPDGRRLVVTAALPVDPDRQGRRSDQPSSPRGTGAPEVVWRLPYKEDGIGYVLGREIHLFELDLDRGEQRQLSDGPFDVMNFDISADGERIAYVRTREGRYAHNYDIWALELATGRHQRVTFDHAMAMVPTWSPDGDRIAFTGAIEEGDAEPRLWLADLASGAVTELGGDDVDVADPETLHWAADGASIAFVRAWRGRHQIASIGVPDGAVKVLAAGDRQIEAFAGAADRWVYSVAHPGLPSEAWACARDGSGEVRLSDLNPWWAEREPIRVEARTFDVPDGEGGTESIEGWLLRAETGAPGPRPLLHDAHGGPHAYALLDFDTNVFWQVLCAQGWAVLALNAVGSASYGRAFCRRLRGRWGELDLPQHLAAIRALQDEGVCDARVAIAGKSYGGFLAAWAIGHTDLFRAAVVMAPIGNVETHHATSDGGYYAWPFYLASEPRFDRERARQLSPLQAIARATTPTLFLQGKDDERCPRSESEQLFVALYTSGQTETELVLYPGETHKFLSDGTPSCRADATARILAWVEHHVARPREAAAAGSATVVTEPA